MNRILIIGATGNIGGAVVSQLKEVRAMVRDPASARLPPHVEVVRGDLTQPGTLDRSLDGIDTVFLVWTAPASAVAPALERIAKHAKRIVYLSAPLKTPHPFFQQPNPSRTLAEQIERLIENSGLAWTFLRPGMFAGNALRWWAPKIRAGETVRWPYLDVATAPIDERDIAAVAVRALCEEHAGAEYVLTGPQSLTQREQLSIISPTARIEEISPEEARRELSAVIPGIRLDAWAAAVDRPAFVTSTVAEILERPARSFQDWARDHAANFEPPRAAVHSGS